MLLVSPHFFYILDCCRTDKEILQENNSFSTHSFYLNFWRIFRKCVFPPYLSPSLSHSSPSVSHTLCLSIIFSLHFSHVFQKLKHKKIEIKDISNISIDVFFFLLSLSLFCTLFALTFYFLFQFPSTFVTTSPLAFTIFQK